MSEQTVHSQERKQCLVFVQHTGFPGKRILSQQTTSSEDMLPACSFSTTPVILAKNIPSRISVLHIWKRISSDQCNSSPSERICITSYLARSTNCRALYKTPVRDKKRKLPLPSLLYLTCSMHFPISFPGIDSIKGVWVYSLLHPLTHSEVCGGQDFGIPLF